MDTDTAAETDIAAETDTAAETNTACETGMAADNYVEQPPIEKGSQVIEAWEDGLGVYKLQEFPSKKALQEVVDRTAFDECFRYVIKKSDRRRLVLKCCEATCKWSLRAAKISETEIFSVRRYTGVHTCSRSNQSKSSNIKRKGSAELVATFLNEEYPGKLSTHVPKDIMDLIKLKLGVTTSYSTALRGKNLAISELRGGSEESYKMLYSYLYMLEHVNPGTKTGVKLDEANKFKYLFVALGACIEGFAAMRKVIVVDATFLKNGYGGVLVFAKAQDPNRHHYPLAFGVLDGENNASWTWFFEMLKTAIPDSSELNVIGHACNTTKAVVAWRFMELARCYTVAEFESAYASFKVRFPPAYKYLEEHMDKRTWARVYFPGVRYNLDTSNSVESMNNVFRDARRYALIPLLDTIIKKFSDWFNEHRKDSVVGSIDTKLVPLVEIHLHNL
ncbi:uncharacterized protein LOC106394273 [Brassica napus]|uniref:uncharacterized protein LOC106394273 n=1 Tax=Brassica napus TaxID=3708 RepID=UPI000BBE34F2|nr:uncharacterized protein LOC106394273 [Brassica napus]